MHHRAPTPFPRGGAPVLALVAAAMLAACSLDDGTSDAADFDHPEAIDDAALVVLGSSDNLARVVDLEVDDDGSLWILNDAPPFFVALDGEGRELHAGGRRGGGPGEFGQPAALVRLDSGVWSWDSQRGTLAKVSGADGLDAGADMRTLPLRESGGGPMRAANFSDALVVGARAWVEASGDEVVLARIPGGPTGNALFLWETEFVTVDATAADATWSPVFSASEHLASPGEGYPGAEVFLPMPFWSQCPDGTLTGYDPVRNTLVRVDREGASLGTVALPRAREVEATPDRIFDELVPRMIASMPSGQAPPLDELRAGFMSEYEQVRSQLARVMPEYRELACGGHGAATHAWLHVLGSGGGGTGGGASWLRVTLSEDAEARVFRMPEGFRPLRLREGVAWGVLYDELEVPHIARLALP